MKPSSFLILPAVAMFGVACERHSADSLPAHASGHGGGHGGGHSAGEASHAAPAHGGAKSEAHPAPQPAAPAAPAAPAVPKTEEKKAAPAAGEAPKFFEEKKSESPKAAK